MELKPIKARRLYEDVLAQIRGLMDGGALKPGDRLMPERELAGQLGVSRSSVREAIRTLEVMGAVVTRPGGGTFVRGADADQVLQPLALALAVERSSLLDMFEVRRVLETATARLAAERATAEDLAGLGEALEGMERSFSERDSEKGERFDVRFHQALATAGHNELLTRLFRTLSEELGRVVSVARRELYQGPGAARRILDQHRAIFEAVRGGDREAAGRRMLEHLSYAERNFRRRLGQGRARGRARVRAAGG